MYYKGRGIPQDYKKAMKWYAKAVEADPGNPRFILTAFGVGYRLEV